MDANECTSGGPATGPRAGERCVREVMLTRPKTLPAEATVADLRRFFTNPRVETALLVEQTRLVGLVDRERLAETLADDAPARSLACRDGVTIGAGATVADAMARLERNGGRRLAVVGDDGVTLEGLICLDTSGTRFCR